MNRNELIAGIRANIAKSISLLQQAETHVEELKRVDDLDMFFVAAEQVSIVLEQVQEGINIAIIDQTNESDSGISNKPQSAIGIA